VTAQVSEISTPAPAQAPRPAFRGVRVPPGIVAVVAIFAATGAFIAQDLSAHGVVLAGFCAVLVVLAAIDLERRIIPNVIVLPAAGLVLLGNILVDWGDAWKYAAAAGASFLVALAIHVVTKGGFGMGDVKLCLLLGAGLAWAVLGAFLLASLAAAAVGIAILVRSGLDARKQVIPYGPFLALGGIVAAFFS
jgi:leader peptidase (prepilin peptidase)/N-methyltransferase